MHLPLSVPDVDGDMIVNSYIDLDVDVYVLCVSMCLSHFLYLYLGIYL